MTAYLAAEAGGPTITAEGWFLENVFIIPLIMGISFAVILFFGKRMPRGGSEVGIAAVGLCLLLSLITAGQWIGQVNKADDCTINEENQHVICDGVDVTEQEKASAFGDDEYAVSDLACVDPLRRVDGPAAIKRRLQHRQHRTAELG